MHSTRGVGVVSAGVRLAGVVAAASLTLANAAAAHHENERPRKPEDRVRAGIHTVPEDLGGLLDYGTLHDGSRILSHGEDPTPPDNAAARSTAALLEAGGPGVPQADNHTPLPHPPIPRPGNPAPDSGFSQIDNLVDDTVDQVLDTLWGPDPAPPPPESPIDCVTSGAPNTYEAIYYLPIGQADRYGEKLPALRSEIKKAMRLMVDEGVGEGAFYRTFKLETEIESGRCEPRVQKIVGTQAGTSFGAVAGDLAANFGRNQASRKYLVFVEGAAGCGQGTIYRDETKQAGNQHNTQTGYAQIKTGCWDRNGHTVLHEITHNLSGVQACTTLTGQEGAPHNNTLGCATSVTTERWHCWDEQDVMCQNDGGPQDPSQEVCTDREWYDCNHDDYFHPNPPAGSYLARKFNVANDSVFVERADATDPLLGDTDAKDVSPLTANEVLYQQTGDDRFAYKVNVSSVAADNWGVDAFVILRSGRRPWNLDGTCPGDAYPAGMPFVVDAGNKRVEVVSETESFGITKPGCYEFDVFAVDPGGRGTGHDVEVLKVSTPQDHAVAPVGASVGL